MTERESNKNCCLVDSNIWLYAFVEAQDSGKSHIAKSVIQSRDVAVTISTQIISEVCVNLVRKVDFSEGKIRELIESFYRKYRVVEINKEILLRASEMREHHRFSFWDSIVFASALTADIDIIYSEDMQDGFTIGRTRIVNPLK